MISFRFHLISITAIFLAMAIGVLVGSTFVDRAIVDGLQNRIDTVEGNLEDRQTENEALESERDRLGSFIVGGADFAVTGRLTDVPVLLLATRGVDEDTVEQLALLAVRAGAVVPGVVWIEDRFALAGEDDLVELQTILDTQIPEPGQLQAAAFEAIFTELAAPDPEVGPPGSTLPDDPEVPTTTIPVVAASPTLDALLGARFLGVEPLDESSQLPSTLAGSGARLLLVTGSTDESLATMPATATTVAVGTGAVVLIADVFIETEEGPERGETITTLLSEEVRDLVVLVDDADLVEGRVAAVLALDAAADGLTGHFGYGPGADAALPQWSPP